MINSAWLYTYSLLTWIYKKKRALSEWILLFKSAIFVSFRFECRTAWKCAMSLSYWGIFRADVPICNSIIVGCLLLPPPPSPPSHDTALHARLLQILIAGLSECCKHLLSTRDQLIEPLMQEKYLFWMQTAILSAIYIFSNSWFS